MQQFVKGRAATLLIWALLAASGCGQKSLVECKAVNDEVGAEEEDNGRCLAKTPDERAVLAMNEGNFALAIELLEPLFLAEPSTYFRIPRLAAAYASYAGFDIMSARQSTGKSSGSSGGGGLSEINQFLPKLNPDRRDLYAVLIDRMGKAKDLLLNAMPASERRASAETFYGASADFQLFLYRASYSAMMMNFYVVPVPDSKDLNEDVLKELSVEQAAVILENLRGTVREAQAGGNSQAIASSEKIDDAVEKIEKEEGSDLSEKLQNYLRRSNGADMPTTDPDFPNTLPAASFHL